MAAEHFSSDRDVELLSTFHGSSSRLAAACARDCARRECVLGRTSSGYETDETDPVVCKGYRRLPQTGGSDADKEELAPITGTN